MPLNYASLDGVVTNPRPGITVFKGSCLIAASLHCCHEYSGLFGTLLFPLTPASMEMNATPWAPAWLLWLWFGLTLLSVLAFL